MTESWHLGQVWTPRRAAGLSDLETLTPGYTFQASTIVWFTGRYKYAGKVRHRKNVELLATLILFIAELPPGEVAFHLPRTIK